MKEEIIEKLSYLSLEECRQVGRVLVRLIDAKQARANLVTYFNEAQQASMENNNELEQS